MLARCSGCGLVVSGGTSGCETLFRERVALEVGDFRYARLHRVVVDGYCLQHPNRYCVSPKSLMAHICGLCIAVEQGSDATAYRSLQQSLNGVLALEKPPVPHQRGSLTIADVLAAASDPGAYARVVDAWAHAVWQAYAPLQGVARDWLQRASRIKTGVAPAPRRC
jgi:Family of unknown function (DUF5946)